MLNPIKSFFTYLQKNANTSNLFRSVNMSAIEDDETGCSATELLPSDVYEDPLSDPLAIEENFNADDLLNNSSSSSCLIIENGEDDDENISDSIIINGNSEKDTEKIIIVDIEKLKNNNNHKPSELKKLKRKFDDEKLEKEQEQEPTVVNIKSCYVKLESKRFIDNKEYSIYNTQEECKTEEAEPVIDVIPVVADELNLPIDSDLVVKPVDVNVNVDSGFVNNTSSETENEENFDAPEELRCSDGSDSGLGLDSLRNVQAIERDLAKLVPMKSNLKRRSDGPLPDEENSPKKSKRNINFGNVTVYYFPRTQGFGCVPSQGGSTLGMTPRHCSIRSFSLNEHASEQRRLHRQRLNETNPCSSSSDDSNSDEEPSENSCSDGDGEKYGFVQPVSARQRRAILKAAGVRKIDTTEKDECRLIRLSREVCGCSCRGYCDPDTCECSQNGIKCQVDRVEFPCACTRDGCGNVNGRMEFNPGRVKTHFIHTIMRLGLEKKPESIEPPPQMLTGYHSSKWIPHSEYNHYTYNNLMPSTNHHSHYSPKMTNGNQSMESLDLYAYRDDYTNQNCNDNNSYNSSSTNNEYYMNYNYLGNRSQYHNNYHHSHQYPSHTTYTHQTHNYVGDTNLYMNSHYVSTQNGFSTDQQQQQPIQRMDAINDLVSNDNTNVDVTNNSHANVNGSNVNTPLDVYETPIINNQQLQQQQQEQHHNNNPINGTLNENLSEIIKKGIVETVTA